MCTDQKEASDNTWSKLQITRARIMKSEYTHTLVPIVAAVVYYKVIVSQQPLHTILTSQTKVNLVKSIAYCVGLVGWEKAPLDYTLYLWTRGRLELRVALVPAAIPKGVYGGTISSILFKMASSPGISRLWQRRFSSSSSSR